MAESDFLSGYDDDDKTIIRPSPGGRRGPLAQNPPRRRVDHDFGAGHLDKMDIASANPLVARAYPLLSLVTKLRRLPQYEAPQQLREKIITALKRMDEACYQQGARSQEIGTARLFLCSLMDEAVLNTPWGNSCGWAGNSLSSYFFREAWGGEKFFQILTQLKQQPDKYLHLLELAHLCLSLGFEGKYRYTNSGPSALETERDALYRTIKAQRNDGNPELSTQWQGMRDVRNPIARYVPFWVLGLIAAAVVMLIFLGYNLAIGNKTDRTYQALVAIEKNIANSQPIQALRPLKTVTLPAAHMDRYRQLLAPEIAAKKVEIVEGPSLRLYALFGSGKARVNKADAPILAKIAKALVQENTQITVSGHTDNQKISISSRFQSNWHLSKIRAESAANLLKAYGVAGNRLKVVGKGDSAPMAPNDSASTRARNRRIDIHIR